jgi:hypothetical protein
MPHVGKRSASQATKAGPHGAPKPTQFPASYASAWITDPAAKPCGPLRQLPSHGPRKSQAADAFAIVRRP